MSDCKDPRLVQGKTVHLAIVPGGNEMVETGLFFFIRELCFPENGNHCILSLRRQGQDWVGGSPCQKRDPDLAAYYEPARQTVRISRMSGGKETADVLVVNLYISRQQFVEELRQFFRRIGWEQPLEAESRAQVA